MWHIVCQTFWCITFKVNIYLVWTVISHVEIKFVHTEIELQNYQLLQRLSYVFDLGRSGCLQYFCYKFWNETGFSCHLFLKGHRVLENAVSDFRHFGVGLQWKVFGKFQWKFFSRFFGFSLNKILLKGLWDNIALRASTERYEILG